MSADLLEYTQARSIKVGDRILLEGRGNTPWKVTSSVDRGSYSWYLTVKRGRETNIIRTFADSWFDKIV